MGQTAQQRGVVDLGAKGTVPAYLSPINIKLLKSENAWLDTVRPKKYISNFKPIQILEKFLKSLRFITIFLAQM